MLISETAVTVASNSPGGALSKIEAFLSAATASARDGLSWREFGDLLIAFLRLATKLYDQVSEMTGAEKKAAVLEGVEQLFDAVADRCVPLVLWPVWSLCRSPVRSLILALASGATDQVLSLVRLA